MTTILVVLLLSLMGAGAGFAVGVLLQPGKSEPAAGPAAGETPETAQAKGEPGDAPNDTGSAEDKGDEGEVDDASLKIVPLPPVITTLAAPAGKWIRLEGSILTQAGGSKPPDVLAEQAGEQILAYLRTVRLEQLQGPSGLLAMRDDLNDTVRSLSKGEVHAVLIHGLLVE